MNDAPDSRHPFDDELAARLREANERVEVPAGLVDRVEASVRSDSPRALRWWWTVPLAAAAVLALLLLVRPGPGPGPAPQTPSVAAAPEAPQTPEPLVPAPSVTRVSFERSDGLFAREVETRRPNVSIFLVYRAVASSSGGDANDQLESPRSES